MVGVPDSPRPRGPSMTHSKGPCLSGKKDRGGERENFSVVVGIVFVDDEDDTPTYIKNGFRDLNM